jgi:CRISPR-associated endoribonuclease Cas6
MDYPVPDPSLIFKSLLRKWNTFSPESLKFKNIPIKLLSENLQIGGLWIKTEKKIVLRTGKLTGFTGRVFINARTSNQNLLKAINTLSLFSEFSGVGRKTTMGFGKVIFNSKEP